MSEHCWPAQITALEYLTPAAQARLMCVGVLPLRTCPHLFVHRHIYCGTSCCQFGTRFGSEKLCRHLQLPAPFSYSPSIHPRWQLPAALQHFLEFGVLHSVHCSFVFLCHCTNLKFCATAQIRLLCEYTNGHCASHAAVTRSMFRK